MSETIENLMNKVRKKAAPQMAIIDEIALENQRKVLNAFRLNRVADRHFKGSTGYGYDDIGRDTLCRLYADVFHAEAALVSPLITGGTHALVLALFGLLRPGDTLLSITGAPYDTLYQAIIGEGSGSMREYGISYEQVDLKGDSFDFEGIQAHLTAKLPKVIFITRSRGYSERNALSIQAIGECIRHIRSIAPNVWIVVDNCYGEFCEIQEPTDVGADLCVGSLIKNIGGGLAPTGGYVVGKKELVEHIAYRFIAPGLGNEVGSYEGGYRMFYQGLFMAPHTVACALKGSLLFAHAFEEIGFKVVPASSAPMGDIIRSICFDTAEQLVAFIQSIQAAAPVDSHVVPEPWDMPGYQDPVIMAAGSFVGGASIELSADAPVRPPYIAYLQGALTYEHAQIAVEDALRAILK